jgi:hypothetical protein
MPRSSLWTALAAALICFAPTARAQAVDTARVTTALWTACPGASVRISTPEGQVVEGRCGRVADGRLQVRGREIPLTQVDSLWMRRSYRAETTLALAAAGTVAGLLLNGEKQEEDCIPVFGCRAREQRARDVLWGVSGAFGGAAVGLTLGSAIQTWRRVVP